MFWVTTTACRICNARHCGQRVICTECFPNPDNGAVLLQRARIATAMYSDLIDTIPDDIRERWETVLDAAATVDSLPEYKQPSAAIQLRKRLDLTAKTPDLFGILTQLYIQYREQCEDVDLYARLLWTIDHDKAAAFDSLRGI